MQKFIIEYLAYFIFIGFWEEILWRGLLLNTLKNIFVKSGNCSLIAVVITAAAFALVHFPGGSAFDIIIKLLYVFAFGVFLGALYIKTKNIWITIIAHDLMNLAGLPQLFSIQPYPDITMYINVSVYVLLGIVGFMILLKNDKHD